MGPSPMSNDPRASVLERLDRNVRDVRGRVRDAAVRAGREPGAVTLVAVTKTLPADLFSLLPAAGITDIGENRIQVAEGKVAQAPAGLRWHLVGHLQRNKARRALELFSCIHSLDSIRLVEQLGRIAGETGATLVKGLVQVNISGEDQKHGVEPEGVRPFLADAASIPGIEIAGLMGMAPFVDDPEEARPYFRSLARIRDDANSAGWYRGPLAEISMGMTNDFEVAVEEGATMVRVGTALFGGLDARTPDAGNEGA